MSTTTQQPGLRILRGAVHAKGLPFCLVVGRLSTGRLFVMDKSSRKEIEKLKRAINEHKCYLAQLMLKMESLEAAIETAKEAVRKTKSRRISK